MPSVYVHLYGVFYVGWTATIRASHLECSIDSIFTTQSKPLIEQELHSKLVGVLWDYMCEVTVPLNMKSRIITFTISNSTPYSLKDEVGKAEVNINTLETGKWKDVWPSVQGSMLGAQLGIRLFADGCGNPSTNKYSKIPKYLRVRMAEAAREGPFSLPKRICIGRNNIPTTAILTLAAVTTLVTHALHRVKNMFCHLEESNDDTDSGHEEEEDKHTPPQQGTPEKPRTIKELLQNVRRKKELAKQKKAHDDVVEKRMKDKVLKLQKNSVFWQNILNDCSQGMENVLWMLAVQVEHLKSKVQEAISKCSVQEKRRKKAYEMLRITSEELSAIRTNEAAKKEKQRKAAEHNDEVARKTARDIPETLKSLKSVQSNDRSLLEQALKMLDKHLESSAYDNAVLLEFTHRIYHLKAQLTKARRQYYTCLKNCAERSDLHERMVSKQIEFNEAIASFSKAVPNEKLPSNHEQRILRGVISKTRKVFNYRIKTYLNSVSTQLVQHFNELLSLRDNYSKHAAIAGALLVVAVAKTIQCKKHQLALFKVGEYWGKSLYKMKSRKPSHAPFRTLRLSTDEFSEKMDSFFDVFSIDSDPELITVAEMFEIVSHVLPRHLRRGMKTIVAPDLQPIEMATPVRHGLYETRGGTSLFSGMLKPDPLGRSCDLPFAPYQIDVRQKHLWMTPESVSLEPVDCISRRSFFNVIKNVMDYIRSEIRVSKPYTAQMVSEVQEKYTKFLQHRDKNRNDVQVNRNANLEMNKAIDALKEEVLVKKSTAAKVQLIVAKAEGKTLSEHPRIQEMNAVRKLQMMKLTAPELQVLAHDNTKKRHAKLVKPKSPLKKDPPPSLAEVVEKGLIHYKYRLRLQRMMRRCDPSNAAGKRLLQVKLEKTLFSKECLKLAKGVEDVPTPPATPPPLTEIEAQILMKRLRKMRKPPVRPDEGDYALVVVASAVSALVVHRRELRTERFRRSFYKSGKSLMSKPQQRKKAHIAIPFDAFQTALFMMPTPPPQSTRPASAGRPRKKNPVRGTEVSEKFTVLQETCDNSPHVADPAWKEHLEKQAKRKETYMLMLGTTDHL
eukprot:TRINITY_DN6858_c0_g1_i1.p1 TRINITY_DN6858_c0_g1~~TRINITY_DN6858_c0_g1_i1.p1  ORF type:complete len:1079 (+),score=237.03 TRINITY_DN6858_c0_g1_i1:37-3237(+)